VAERAAALTMIFSPLADSCFTTSLPTVPVAPVMRIVSVNDHFYYLAFYLCLVVTY
jgi:hypothetical protein